MLKALTLELVMEKTKRSVNLPFLDFAIDFFRKLMLVSVIMEKRRAYFSKAF